jgi:hypothetical protein
MAKNKLTKTQQEVDELIKKMDEYFKKNPIIPTHISYSTSTNPNLVQHGWTSMIGGMSPTDVDAKSMYPYQEPEQDEQGTMYGYKVLNWDERYNGFVSPRYPAHWTTDGQLHSDREPGERIMNGIHFTKRPDHPELRNYNYGSYGFNPSHAYYEYKGSKSFLVKCALSGTIVVTEQGFRSQHAQIISVMFNGSWISYQDFYMGVRNERNRIDSWEVGYGGQW